jgi:hypothetical protein
MRLFRSDEEAMAYRSASVGALVSRAFPRSSTHLVQLIADCTTLLCVLDDRAEALPSPRAVAAYLAPLLDVCDGPREAVHREHVLPAAIALADVLRRAAVMGSRRAVRRVVVGLEEIFSAYAAEAYEREAHTPPDLETYVQRRRVTIGLRPLFALWELELGAELPEEVRAHPGLARMAARTCNVVGWTNDLFTCAKELKSGEVQNLVIVLMAQEGLSYGEAVERAVAMHDAEVHGFVQDSRALPSLGSSFDASLGRYVDMLGSCMRGHLSWAHETSRYSGDTPASTLSA